MFKNYLLIALRNFKKNRIYSLINVIGLTIGITCCLVIFFYITQELSYDSFHNNSHRIYRVALRWQNEYMAATPIPLAPVLDTEYPEIEKTTRIFFKDKVLIRSVDKTFYETGVAFADSTFFKIFSFELIAGNSDKALATPNSVVLTESYARKYFGKENPLGKVIKYDNVIDLKITGIVKDVPVNSHFSFDFLISYITMGDARVYRNTGNWDFVTSSYTYILVKPYVSIDNLQKKSTDIIDRKDNPTPGTTRRIFYQPVKSINLYSHLGMEIRPNNTFSTLIVLSTIGLFLLLIACINYMNLTTARSMQRSKEIGIRKVMGAFRFQLVKQFIAESILITLISFVLALISAKFTMPYFSNLLNKQVSFSFFNNWEIIFGITLLVLAIGVISGAYPAFYLSGVNPIKVLKGNNDMAEMSGSVISFRKILVVFQFSLCALIIFGTITVSSQLEYLHSANMGFEKDYNVVIPIRNIEINNKYEIIENRFLQIPKVKSVTAAYTPPLNERVFTTSLTIEGAGRVKEFDIKYYSIDMNYIRHFGLKLLAGRGFSNEDLVSGKNNFIVNEETVKKLGFHSPWEAIGKEYRIGANDARGPIIGVVKNYNVNSLHEKILPIIMTCISDNFRTFTVKIAHDQIQSTIKEIGKVWKEFQPQYPFEYQFLDEYISSLYNNDKRVKDIVSFFAIVTIVIACLGLFGLFSYSVGQKKKVIGIRKVMGAKVSGIVFLILKEFVGLVFISNLIALPIASYLMNEWLIGFEYKINLSLFIFIYSGLLTLLIALLTISYQGIKAALANPVDSLKGE